MSTLDHVPLDLETALEYVGGDEALLHELLDIFLEDCPARLETLRDAAAAGAPLALMSEAHGLKGSLRALGATRAAGLAERLEQMGRTAELDGLAECLVSFEREAEAVLRSCAAIARAQ